MNTRKNLKRKDETTDEHKFETPVIPISLVDYISATKTRNAILKDWLLDWFDMYGVEKGFIPDEKQQDYNISLDFKKYITFQGVTFENKIIKDIITKIGNSNIGRIGSGNYLEGIQETIDHMKKGTPIILQGIVFSEKDKVYGIPDIIIRSDFINKLFNIPVISDTQIGCEFSKEWHYRVIDIKFSSLKLKANLTTMLNEANQKFYKSQVYVYNLCLGNIQGYTPQKAYILGRGWSGTYKGTLYYDDNPLSKPGVVDFGNDDQQVKIDTLDALHWYQDCKQNGRNWNVLPKPSVSQLYPNMSNNSASSWDKEKNKLAIELKEITSLWQCGYEQRLTAHANKIFSYKDIDCSAETLGVNGEKTKYILNKILDVNKENNSYVFYPDKIQNNLFNWRVKQKEFYIDFESVNAVYDVNSKNNGMIYLIGIGYLQGDSWNYKSFVVNSLLISEEARIIKEFIDFIEKESKNVYIECINCDKLHTLPNICHTMCECTFMYCPTFGWWDGNAQCQCDQEDYLNEEKEQTENNFKLYHYSNAEVNLFKTAINRIGISKEFNFCDLLEIIKQEPVVIKGALNFSLKTVVKALNDLGKIKINYNSLNVKSGLDGLMVGIVAEKERIIKNIPFQENQLIKESLLYNEIDTKSIYEILSYLRNNH